MEIEDASHIWIQMFGQTCMGKRNADSDQCGCLSGIWCKELRGCDADQALGNKWVASWSARW